MTEKRRRYLNMKKLLAFMLAAMLVIGLTGCGNKKEKPYDYNLEEYLTEGQYKGIELSEKKIKEELESAKQKLIDAETSTVVVTDRAIKDGDTVDFKYEGYLEGETKPFEGGSGSQSNFVIGNNNFIEGFDKAMIGHGGKDDREFTIEVTFPDDYHKEDMRGKKANFKITVNKIIEQIVPEFDDEFVKEHSIYSSVEEYNTKVTRNIKANLAFEIAVERFVAKKFPEKELKEAYDAIIQRYMVVANYSLMDLKTYVTKYMKMKMDEFWEDCAKQASKQVKQDMVLYYILRKEALTLTDDEYSEGALELAKTLGYDSIEELQKERKVTKDELYDTVLLSKVKYFLADNSIVNEDIEETTDETTEKETTPETEPAETEADTQEETNE